MKRSTLAMIATCAFIVSPALANACTQQEAMAKGTQLSQLVQTKMAQDPTQGQALMAKMQPIMMANQGQMSSGGQVDWDKVCSQYDSLIKQAH